MCEFCGNATCTLTKQQVIERGAILESNAYGINQTDRRKRMAAVRETEKTCY